MLEIGYIKGLSEAGQFAAAEFRIVVSNGTACKLFYQIILVGGNERQINFETSPPPAPIDVVTPALNTLTLPLP